MVTTPSVNSRDVTKAGDRHPASGAGRHPASGAGRQQASGVRSSAVSPVEIGLTAAIITVRDNEPMVLVVSSDDPVANSPPDAMSNGLPSGPFSPLEHRTFEIGLKASVARQTDLELGYVEQLYTFGDRGRHAEPGDAGPHVVSIGYLALTLATQALPSSTHWRSWYEFFPWEDRRDGAPQILDSEILPRLAAWARLAPDQALPERPVARPERVRMCFGADAATWDEEKVLERYELLYEAGLVGEAARDGRLTTDAGRRPVGITMRFDHRRILATAIGRIRAKIKYRPVIFELLPDDFTLYELQRTVEAILGPHLHKQNFRRLVEAGGLVEPTGDVKSATGGRPAKLYRFRRDVLLERPSPGVRVNLGRG
jgi:hypothetical protein